MTPPKNPMVYERLLCTDLFRFKYMFNVSIREYFSVLNVFIVCMRNTAVFKLIPLLCTHVYSYMFSTMHPPRSGQEWIKLITNLAGALHINQMNLACKKRAIEDTLTHSSNLSVFGSRF